MKLLFTAAISFTIGCLITFLFLTQAIEDGKKMFGMGSEEIEYQTYKEVDGIEFKAPAYWNFLKKPTNESVVLYAGELKIAEPLTGLSALDANNNPLLSGAQFSIVKHESDLGESVKDSLQYAQNELEDRENCSNCEDLKLIEIDGVPGIFFVSNFYDHGGWAAISLYKDGEIVTIIMLFVDNFAEHSSEFDAIVNTIKFTN